MILTLDILSRFNELFVKLWGLFVFPSFIVCNCICYHLTIDWLFKKFLKRFVYSKVMSGSLQPHGLQHFRLPCLLLSPRVCSNSCPLSWCCPPTISSSVTPFFWCPQSFLASKSFPVNWLFASGGQSIGASASPSVRPVNIQGRFPLGLTGLILLSAGLMGVSSITTVQKCQFFGTQSSLWSSSHICTWLLEKPQLWLYGPLSAKLYLCFLICCLGLS